jgi:hypothetical protein
VATEHSQDPGGLYAGEITDQFLAPGKSGEVQLILTVKVTAVVKDVKAPTESAVPCPHQEVEVWLSFSETAEDRLRMSLRDLERLGFMEEDLLKLHPDHPECRLLVGAKVHVKSKVTGTLTYWNLAWPRERPKPVAIGAIKGATDALAARILAIRAKKGKDVTTGTADQVGNTSDEE